MWTVAPSGPTIAGRLAMVAVVGIGGRGAVAMGLGEEAADVVPHPGLSESVGVGAPHELATVVERVLDDRARAVDDAVTWPASS